MEFDSPPASLPDAGGDPLTHDLDGWNWGAFLVPTFWSSYYQIWPAVIAVALPLPFIWPLDLIGWWPEFVAQFLVGIYLGRNGSELAWRKWRGRRWSSTDAFWSAQRRWAWGGLAGTIAFFVIGIVTAAIVKTPEQLAREVHSFHGHGISFEYPGNLGPSDPDEMDLPTDPANPPLWVEPFTLDTYDVVAIQAQALPFVVTSGNVENWATLLNASAPASGASLLELYHPLVVAGLPAAEATIALDESGKPHAENWTGLIFKGTTAIRWDCQYTEENREALLSACRQVRESIALDDGFDERVNWTELDEPGSHVSVLVPPSWEERSPPKGFELRAELEGINLVLGSQPFTGSLHRYTEIGLRDITRVQKTAEIVSRSRVTIASGPAEVTHVRVDSGDQPLNLVVYTLVKGLRGYFLLVGASDEDYAFVEPTAAAIADTLRIKS